jgi:hypothetical protein
MDNRLVQFVHGLYFDIQTIEGVKPLEIWNGVRERDDPFEKTGLVKNLYKIAIPLVNERCFRLPFEVHSRSAKETVARALADFAANPEARLFDRFPYPPTGDGDQKELYRFVQAQVRAILEEPADGRGVPEQPPETAGLSGGVFPDGLFDFREMRLADNEMPYIIFTDKEYRVIHGLAIVYLWLIDLDAIFLGTLSENGVDAAIIEEYRQFGRKVHKENPLTIHGKRFSAGDLAAHIHEKLKYEDYLDLFENVYRWFEQAREKFAL